MQIKYIVRVELIDYPDFPYRYYAFSTKKEMYLEIQEYLDRPEECCVRIFEVTEIK